MNRSAKQANDAAARKSLSTAIPTIAPALTIGIDSLAWISGMVIAVWARYESAVSKRALVGALALALIAAAANAVLSSWHLRYRGRYAAGTFDEVRAVATTVLTTGMITVAINLGVPSRLTPASAPGIGCVLALVMMLAGRFQVRQRHERSRRPSRATAAPALLFGAGSAGHILARALLNDPSSRYLPVGVIDDDPAKRRLRVHGVPVLGDRTAIAGAVRRAGAAVVIFSVANADAEVIRAIRQEVVATGAAFKVVPSISELLAGRASLADVRDAGVNDLLGRRPVGTDVGSVAGYLSGKRVLVTGAGGSIGSELCRQISRHRPGELIMLDRDESALHAVQLSLSGRALLDSPELVLADLRDADAVREIFAERRPEVVFHTAALKHLTLLERHPAEAIKTNIMATLNLLECAQDVSRFINISTDKAANPTCVLGYTKRITERLTAHAGLHRGGTFLNVRFGNVLGSRGSVLTSFIAQIAAGGPVTVTHPEVSRFFMTIQEAVQLVIHAAAIGRDGEALVLDMGRPVRIADAARQLIEQEHSSAQIVFTGLRPGEKLHEQLFGDGELDSRPLHPLISHVNVPALHPSQVAGLLPDLGQVQRPDQLIARLASLCSQEARPVDGPSATVDSTSVSDSIADAIPAAARRGEAKRPRAHSGITEPVG